MKICMCRVDDRLVHGQITAVWVKHFKISHIFVVDGELSNNSLATNVLCMAAPPKVEVQVLSVTQMTVALHGETFHAAHIKAMILFRNLETARNLLAQTGRIFDVLSLGGMPSRIGRHELGKNLYFTKEERRLALDMMDRYGISLFSQMLPSDAPVDVGAMIRENARK